MWLFDILRGMKKWYKSMSPSPLLTSSLSIVVLVQEEAYDAVSISLQSSALIRKLMVEEVAGYHGLDPAKDLDLITWLGRGSLGKSICSCYSQNVSIQKIADYCGGNDILFFSPSPRIVSKASLLASSLGILSGSVVLILDTGVKVTKEDAQKLINKGVSKFMSPAVALILGRNKTAALVRTEYRTRGSILSAEPQDFLSLIHSLEKGVKANGGKIRYISYLSFM